MIATTNWLAENREAAVIFDCRFNLMDAAEGQQLYSESHISGAYYAHLDQHLSGEKGSGGGRHPLPDMQEFQAFMEKCGVTRDRPVVAYDDGSAMFAGRLWWLLTFSGHSHVYVLDGGFQEWNRKKLPVTNEVPADKAGNFPIHMQKHMRASMEEVAAGSALLIDSRAPERYRGETEPLDRVPGHIPGAVNCFFAEGLKDGMWKSAEEQQARFAGIAKTDPVIVYCGSGVSATPNIIALKMAGYQNVKLYPGSYSEWSSDEARPIETKGRDFFDK